MIARILYRESVHGVLNYVFNKGNSKILGFKNVSPEMEQYPDLFKHHLYFLGNRHETKKRYAHITLNLPHGEFVRDKTFFKLASEYMEQMGYGEQPFTVVRHEDTKHAHVHIVTTTVKEDISLVPLSNDYIRNITTQKYLENKFGLQPSPEVKSARELPTHRLPQAQPLPDDSKGVKFYIQDILNTVLQRYTVRSFDELAELVRPYHILVSQKINASGRLGVAYGIAVNKGYKSRFINGSIVHPELSGPKLEAKFYKNRESKLLPMHRKRLEKQILTTINLFQKIHPKDITQILKDYQKIDAVVSFDSKKSIQGLTVYDKSGFIFSGKEINRQINGFLKNHENDNGSYLDIKSKQYNLEIQKLIRTALYRQYLRLDKKNTLHSEFIMTRGLNKVMGDLINLDGFQFLSNYIPVHSKEIVAQFIQKEFPKTRKALFLSEHKKEAKLLENKASLIQEITKTHMFGFEQSDTLLFELVQSLGVKYGNGTISYVNSNTHTAALKLSAFKLPKQNTAYVSTGFLKENEKMLQFLVQSTDGNEQTTSATSFFLPMIFPTLYSSMSSDYCSKYEQRSLRAYLIAAEKSQEPFERSVSSYIQLLNAKGFYFEKKGTEFYLMSIYGKTGASIPLPKKTQNYLKSSHDLDSLIQNQTKTISPLVESGRDRLQNLWVSYLIEKGLYDKAAFMVVYDGVRPNLSTEVLEHHMSNGLKDKILLVSKKKLNAQHTTNLRKSVYAFSALLGKTNEKEHEMFNGFKDELTDYSKYKNVFF